MSFDFIGCYRFRLGNFLSTTAILAVVFLCAKFFTSDVLTLGYAMVVPVFVLLSVFFTSARTDKRDLRSFWVWIETSIAVLGAAGVGYLGYRLWLLGF